MHGLLLDFIIFKRGRKRGKEMSGQTQISCLFANDRGGLPCDISYIIYHIYVQESKKGAVEV